MGRPVPPTRDPLRVGQLQAGWDRFAGARGRRRTEGGRVAMLPRSAPATVAPPAADPVPPATDPMPPSGTAHTGAALLAGYAIAVVSDRRRHQLCGLLEAAGVRTVAVQGVRTFSTVDDGRLKAQTLRVLATPID